MDHRPRADNGELFRLVVENVEDFAIFATDLEGHLLSWNPGVERLLGYAEDEWLGRDASIIFDPEPGGDARALCKQEMSVALAHGRAEDRRWHRRKDGSLVWVSGLLMLLRDEAGAPSGFAKIVRDETGRRLAREELQRAHDELEHRVEERTSELQEVTGLMLDEVKERRAGEGQIRELLRRVIDAQELERKRIARDLHDNLGQLLVALRIHLEALETVCDGQAEVRERLGQAQQIAGQIDAEVDFIAWELRPAALDVLGFEPALGNFVGEWSRHYGVPADYQAAGFGERRLAPEVEINLYRIMQEALNNVYKHAGATRVSVLATLRGDQAVLVVEDDGQGFEPGRAVDGEKGMGLLSMKERAALVGGTLEIESEPGQGATLYVRVPARYA